MIRRLLLVSLVMLLAPAPKVAHATDGAAARAGAAWLARAVPASSGDGAAADAVMALRITGRLSRAEAGRRAAGLRRGARRYAVNAGTTGKLVLGLAAAGANPRCASGVDLLARIARFGRAGRYGATAYDQGYGMLALRALGLRVPSSAVRFLLRSRGSGGWSFTLSRARGDDVGSTALAIMALRAAGVSRRNAGLRAAFRWLRAQRTAAGGFAELRRDRNEANSTARAIQAAIAMGTRDARAERALKTLQRRDGAFQFTRNDAGSRVLATNDAVQAMAGRVLPVVRVIRTPGAC